MIDLKSSDIQAVFWDIDSARVGQLPIDFVVRRALSYGSIFLCSALIKKYGVSQVRTIFETMKPTAISRRKHAYLKKYLLA